MVAIMFCAPVKDLRLQYCVAVYVMNEHQVIVLENKIYILYIITLLQGNKLHEMLLNSEYL